VPTPTQQRREKEQSTYGNPSSLPRPQVRRTTRPSHNPVPSRNGEIVSENFPMTGGGSSTRRPAAVARSRGRPSEASEPDPGARRAAAAAAQRRGRGNPGPLRLMDVRPRTLAYFVVASFALVSVTFVVYTGGWWEEVEGEGAATLRKVMRSVTPLPAPRMMDLPQVMPICLPCCFCPEG
jgi:mannosyl-oligosaccharide glucosidase